MRRRGRTVNFRDFKCTVCGQRMCFPKRGMTDKQDHIKTVYCPICKKTTDFLLIGAEQLYR